MPSYQRGAKGKEVTRIQTRLKELGFYTGPLDGDFGGRDRERDQILSDGQIADR